MTQHVKIRIQNEVWCTIFGLSGRHHEYMYDKYSEFAPNYFFNPKYKLGQWDGKIRFYRKDGTTYLYFIEDIVRQICQWGYTIEIDDKRTEYPLDIPPIDNNIFADVLHPETGEPIILRDLQVDAVNAVLPHGNGTIVAATGAGKAQPLDAKVLTPDGWTTMGSIEVGDSVIASDGTTASVLGVFPQGIKPIYEIVFHDGSRTRACGEHLWTAHVPIKPHSAKTHLRTIQTHEIASFLARKDMGKHTPGNISIPMFTPPLGNDADLPVDPYLLGVLIGDGGMSTASVMLSNTNEQLLSRVSALCEAWDVDLRQIGTTCDFRLSKKEKHNTFPPTPNKLTQALDRLGLKGCMSNTKFIPAAYMSGSSHQRLELLRGLMDTDGTADRRGNTSFTTVSIRLATDVQQLCWSLGFTCTIASRHPTYTHDGEVRVGQLAYTCHIRSPRPNELFYVDAKRDRCRSAHADGRIPLTRRVVSVQLVDAAPAQCILIDHPSHLYVTDDYIVTHNTLLTAALCKTYGDYGIRTLTIVPSTNLIRQTKADYDNCGLEPGEYSGDEKTPERQHVVSTWQALKNNPKIVSMFQMLIVDECLAGDTLVSMADGTTKRIDSIVPGDHVISYNEQSKQFVDDEVVKVHRNLSKSSLEKMYMLEMDTGECLEVTGNHQILTTDGYVRADQLTADHEVLSLL